MTSLHSLSDQVSGLSAKTVQAFAHRLRAVNAGTRHGYSSSVPTKGVIGDPTSLTASRRNPHSRPTIAMNDGQSPLSFKIKNIIVGNLFSAQWIDNRDAILMKNQLGSNPNQVCDCCQGDTESKFHRGLHHISQNQNAVRGKKQDQKNRYGSPHVVASWSEGVEHMPIISGDRK